MSTNQSSVAHPWRKAEGGKKKGGGEEGGEGKEGEQEEEEPEDDDFSIMVRRCRLTSG